MSVKSINLSENTRQKRLGQQSAKRQSNPQFTGSFNPIVTVTDSISRGGFAASFIAQDGIGMVAPRIWEGLNRGRKREKDPVTGEENGKKTGPYNWAFARREGVREILSGPSAFLIPAGILAVIKKNSGKANNVPIDMINTLGENFAKVAVAHTDTIKNIKDLKDAAQTKAIKKDFYKQMFKSTLETSLANAADVDYDVQAAKMADKLLEIESAPSKGFLKHFIGKATPGKREDLMSELVEEFMNLRKNFISPTENEMKASIGVSWREKNVTTTFNKMVSNMMDYTDDVIQSSNKYLKNNAKPDFEAFLKSFNHRRSGSRLLSNFGMFFAVVGFYDIIPKLYNIGIKENVDEVKEQNEENAKAKDEKSAVKTSNDKKSKEVPFTGMAKINENIGQKIIKGGWAKKLSDKFEFDGAAMSVPAMLTLLFGFCLPPRYRDAKDHHERREIIVRDVSSFTAILFGAKALSRGFSNMFAKLSGLALNTKPDDHSKGIFYKLKNYFTPGHNGIEVLGSAQLSSKHSNLKQYKDGISGYIEFLKTNDGDARKVFAMDKNVKTAAEEILGGKKLKDVTIEELEKAFKLAKEQGSKALDTIYSAFEKPNNKFVNRAKTLNSTFEFASIILLVPAFMIWLARYCERMTKANKEKERAMAEANNPQNNQTVDTQKIKLNNQIPPHINASKPTMAGFISK